MDFLAWLIMGALAGWIASVIMKTNSQQGVVLDILLGIAGAVVGGLLMNFLGAPGVSGFNIYSLVVSVVGAAVLIGLGRAVSRT